MGNRQIKKVVIVGGGTAGWVSAAALARFFNKGNMDIVLVESEQIGIIGVGEATIPHLRSFNETLGLDEAEFMRRTQATFKMGIEFKNWGRIGDSYIHPFGEIGQRLAGVDFHHYVTKLRAAGKDVNPFDHCLPVRAAKQGKFDFPAQDKTSILSTFTFAYHLDASLYAPVLREYSENLGVRRIEGKVVDVALRPEDGFITSIKLENGSSVEGDLFIDCSGFRGVLIEQALKTGYLDWRQYLPCDRAVAVPCETEQMSQAYSTATALGAGWQWRIPLQHRVGNGYVYCSEYISDDEAGETMLSNLEGKPLADPKFLRFMTGRRKKIWNKNCVAIGLSSGFLEPLESTSIYLIQQTITALIELFPDQNFNPHLVGEFNRVMNVEFDRIRDFLVLHYNATERDDTPFWDYCREMEVPQSLATKMSLFKKRGIIQKYEMGLFLDSSWAAVYQGQRIRPQHYDPRADLMSHEAIASAFASIRNRVEAGSEQMPKHEDFLNKFVGQHRD